MQGNQEESGSTSLGRFSHLYDLMEMGKKAFRENRSRRSNIFARLQNIHYSFAGKNLYIRFTCNTGDDIGMNMVSKGVQNILDFIQNDFPDMDVIGISVMFLSFLKRLMFKNIKVWWLGSIPRRGQLVFVVGLGALVFVPLFKALTGLPPYLGMLFGLEVLWILTDAIFFFSAVDEKGQNTEDENFPFTLQGIVPDIVINSLAFPSRYKTCINMKRVQRVK